MARAKRLIFDGPDAPTQIQLHEENELANPVVLRNSDLTAKDTESIIRGQMKSRRTCYLKQRAEGKYNGSLLRKIMENVAVYLLIVPGFWPHPVLSIDDLK